jgi:hypothetical protein
VTSLALVEPVCASSYSCLCVDSLCGLIFLRVFMFVIFLSITLNWDLKTETQAKTLKDLRLKKTDCMARVYWTHENILTQLAALSLFVSFCAKGSVLPPSVMLRSVDTTISFYAKTLVLGLAVRLLLVISCSTNTWKLVELHCTVIILSASYNYSKYAVFWLWQRLLSFWLASSAIFKIFMCCQILVLSWVRGHKCFKVKFNVV